MQHLNVAVAVIKDRLKRGVCLSEVLNVVMLKTPSCDQKRLTSLRLESD